jgi:hypothetical protein
MDADIPASFHLEPSLDHCRLCPSPGTHARGFCKPCYLKNWRKENPALAASTRAAYYQANKERLDKKSAAWRSAHPDRAKDIYRRCVFGLTAETYQAALKEQDNACAICKAPFSTEKRKGPYVDHCLGNFSDSTELLQAAILYLQKFAAARLTA